MLVAEGKLNSIDDREYDVNESLTSGETKYVIVSWDIPNAAGDDIQGDTIAFDMTVELNQKDSQ